MRVELELRYTLPGGHQPAINRPSTGYQPAINRPSTGHQPAINRPSTGREVAVVAACRERMSLVAGADGAQATHTKETRFLTEN
jgi:hypothetical protein